MGRISIFVFPIVIFLFLPMTISVEENVKMSLVAFIKKVSAGMAPMDPSWGWNISSDPCIHKWLGVNCTGSQQVKKIVLEGLNFNGTLDATSLCTITSLEVLSLKGNKIVGSIPGEIGNCRRLTHFFVSHNQFSGAIPGSISQLMNLKRIDISNNNFSGELPDLSRISGLLSFLAQDNQLSGPIPNLNFFNLVDLNVSNNNFSGPIPDVQSKFKADSFSGNPGLCGKPLLNACPPAPAPSQLKSKHSSVNRVLIYSGYIILAFLVLLFVVFKIVTKNSSRKERNGVASNRSAGESKCKSSTSSSSSWAQNRQENRSEYSITFAENGSTSSSLMLLTSPMLESLKFEDLLRAPAELLGRGKHGSLYKVMLGNCTILAVKRIKDWDISCEDFKSRMQRIDQVRHPNVLAPLALYCSKQEKLLVYQYQPNGSLFTLLHGSQMGKEFNWGSRLRIAAIVSEALAFMHQKLGKDGITHGNLKSTNILFDKHMEPCISEYGLMLVENLEQSILSQTHSPGNDDLTEDGTYYNFKFDVYGFGVILLELLTGKLVQNNGYDLARWVHSVVREEWTDEVFDRALILEGVSEERMVNLLQVALKCINPSPKERPNMNQVVMMVHRIKEEEDRSNSSDP